MSDTAIKVEGVSKSFKLPHERHNSIKSLFVNVFRQGRTFEKQDVLKNVSFEIKHGEFFGIVGRNGSGKSTLLKLIAEIYTPDKGRVQIAGKLTPFIELGVGFNPELTGRENVYLNGALLGFNRDEMDKMYDEIVEFAELERFMDQKLKNYSSGMQVRLAFSIAIRAKSEILVLDEVLAVGDAAFQQKCIDIFENYKANKKTVVLVTHDMEIVKRFCTKAALINDGQLIEVSNPHEIARQYAELNFAKTEEDMQSENAKGTNSKISLKMLSPDGSVSSPTYHTFDTMKLEIGWPENLKGVKNAGVAIHKNSGEYIFGANTFMTPISISGNRLICEINLDIGSGKYRLVAGLFGDQQSEIIEFETNGPKFIVKPSSKDQEQGLVRLKTKWGEG